MYLIYSLNWKTKNFTRFSNFKNNKNVVYCSQLFILWLQLVWKYSIKKQSNRSSRLILFVREIFIVTIFISSFFNFISQQFFNSRLIIRDICSIVFKEEGICLKCLYESNNFCNAPVFNRSNNKIHGIIELLRHLLSIPLLCGHLINRKTRKNLLYLINRKK